MDAKFLSEPFGRGNLICLGRNRRMHKVYWFLNDDS